MQLITATLWEPSRSLIKKKPEQQRQHTLYITLKFSGGVNIPFIPGNKKAPLYRIAHDLVVPCFQPFIPSESALRFTNQIAFLVIINNDGAVRIVVSPGVLSA